MIILKITKAIVELYRKAATELPDDVVNAIVKAQRKEKKSSIAYNTFSQIIETIKIAKEKKNPICQDTGMPIFYVKIPAEASIRKISQEILNATRIATKEVPLRSNSVFTLNNKNTGNSVGLSEDKTNIHLPIIYIEEHDKKEIIIDLLLKGGGSENVGRHYSLPDKTLKAGRDLDGVRKCIIDCVKKAKGFGCPPGIVGVSFGSPKDFVAQESKKQLLRKLDDTNENKILNRLEKNLLKELNKLNIGVMGLGGKTTVMGVKVKALHRHPACFFVDISYSCWALRRKRLIYNNGKVLIE